MKSKDAEDNCDPLMLWAMRASDRKRFVHVGMLTPKENGAACGCLCVSCGERLIAINANKAPSHFELPRTKRRHFQHKNSSADEARCLKRVAQLLALRLFAEQDVVFLPGRDRPARRRLPNGRTLMADLSSPPERVGVLSRTWVDDFSVDMVLSDGRQMRVTIRAHHTVKADLSSTCVLSLAGACDPMIASWDTEKILQHLRAPQNGLQWALHWDDAERFAQAADALAQEQSLVIGDVPPEWLQGLNGKQFNETILHYLIKKAVAERGAIKVPAYRFPVRRMMPDGERGEVDAFLPACTLVLDNVRLEKRLENMVPDVLCLAAVQGTSGPWFDLMIEGAVTHRIDAEKYRKIVAADVACIEITAALFGRVGAVAASEIEEIVCSSAVAKQWIHLPQALRAAEQKLDRQAAAVRRRLANEERERKLAEQALQEKKRREAADNEIVDQWLARCSDAALVKGYVKILKSLWGGHPEYSTGHKADQHKAVINELRRREISTESSTYVETGSGVLRQLITARDGLWKTTGEASIRAFENASRGGLHATYAVDLMLALAEREKEMSNEQAQAFQECAALVRKGIREENAQFKRDEKRLRLHALVIPALRNSTEAQLGTPSHYDEMKRGRENMVRRATVRAQRLAKVSSGRAKQKKSAKEQAIKEAIDREANDIRWNTFPFGGPATSFVLLTRYNQNPPKNVKFVDLSVQDLFQKAESFRRSSGSVKSAFEAMSFKVTSDVQMASLALLHVGICARKY